MSQDPTIYCGYCRAFGPCRQDDTDPHVYWCRNCERTIAVIPWDRPA